MSKPFPTPPEVVPFYIDELADGAGLSRSQFKRALVQLEAHGFIAPTSDRPIAKGGAFRLTMFETWDGKPATREYLKWTPPVEPVKKRIYRHGR